MASNINANNIDGTYPIAGVDNDSQGFRTNFTNIKNNLAYTKTEIEDLQSKVLLKSPLNGTTLNNNMAGTVFSGAEIRDIRETKIDLGTASGTITLDHSMAHNYAINTNGSISLAFTNFPVNGKLGRIRLKIVLTSASHTVTLPLAVSLGINGIQGLVANTITFSSTGTYYLEFTTDDQGATIHVEDQTRSRNKINDVTNSNSKSDGSFVVAGGVGIGGNLNVGGNLSVSNNFAIGGTLSLASISLSGNSLTSGSSTITGNIQIGNNATVNGNITTAGISIGGRVAIAYTYLSAASGFTLSMNGPSQVIVDSDATLATGTIFFPIAPIDGQRIGISSNNAISSLTLTANTGTIIGRVTSLTANSMVNYQYVTSVSKWFRI